MTFDEAEKLMQAGMAMRCKRWHPARYMKVINKVHWFCSRKGKPFPSDFVLEEDMETYKSAEWER